MTDLQKQDVLGELVAAIVGDVSEIDDAALRDIGLFPDEAETLAYVLDAETFLSDVATYKPLLEELLEVVYED